MAAELRPESGKPPACPLQGNPMPINSSSGPVAPDARLDATSGPTVPQDRPAGAARPRTPPDTGHDLQSLRARHRNAGHAGAEAPEGRPVSPMKRHRVKLTGYLLTRTASGQPITDPDSWRMLKDGADSMAATCQRLWHSNVIPAVEKSGNESYIRGAIGQAIGMAVEATLGPDDRANQKTATIAAIGQMVGAGGCDSFAADVVHEHAGKLRAGERIERVAATDFHSWAQLHAPGKPDIALDPWSQDPAMLAEDRTLVAHYLQGHVYNPEKAAQDLALARTRVNTPTYHQYAADNLRQQLASGVVPPENRLFAPISFVDPALSARAELALAKLPVQDQLALAMRVAVEQLGASPEAAALAAPDIVAAAKNLHRR